LAGVGGCAGERCGARGCPTGAGVSRGAGRAAETAIPPGAGPLPAAAASVAVGGQSQQQSSGADECNSACRGRGGGVRRVGGCGASLRAACRSQPAAGQRRVGSGTRRGRPPREARLPRRQVPFGAAAASSVAAVCAEDTAAAGRGCGGDGQLFRCGLTPCRRRHTMVGARRCRVPADGAVGDVGVGGPAPGRRGQCGARRAAASASLPR